MDPVVLVALITAIPSTLAALIAGASLIASWRNGQKLTKVAEEVDGNNQKLTKVAQDVDGKLDALFEARGRADRAEGQEVGRLLSNEEAAAAALIAPAHVVAALPAAQGEVSIVVGEQTLEATVEQKPKELKP